MKFCRFEQIRDNFVPHRNTIQNTMTMLLDLNCSRGDPLMNSLNKMNPREGTSKYFVGGSELS